MAADCSSWTYSGQPVPEADPQTVAYLILLIEGPWKRLAGLRASDPLHRHAHERIDLQIERRRGFDSWRVLFEGAEVGRVEARGYRKAQEAAVRMVLWRLAGPARDLVDGVPRIRAKYNHPLMVFQ
ncbi:MAG: hypothetical protein ACOC00_08680 [Halothiobacillaceae bacterium]